MGKMMTCERMHARIPMTTCVGRQMKGIKMKDAGGQVYSLIPVECRDCEVGTAMLASTHEGKEEIMVQTKSCWNCGRVMSVVGDGCCFTCYRAGRGLEGEQKVIALAAVKAKIESGTMRKGGGRRGPRTAAGKAAPAEVPQKKLTRNEKHKKYLIEHGMADSHEGGLAVALESVRAEGPSPEALVNLVFGDDRDLDLYTRLLDQSVRHRRSIEQQILWILQNAIEQEAGLLAEASGR